MHGQMKQMRPKSREDLRGIVSSGVIHRLLEILQNALARLPLFDQKKQ